MSFAKRVQLARGKLPLLYPPPKLKTFGRVLGNLNGTDALE